MSDKIVLARLAVHLFASVGVSKVVNDIIVNNTTILTTADAVKVWTGSLVIGSVVADHFSKHLNTRMDNVQAWHESRKAVPAIAE